LNLLGRVLESLGKALKGGKWKGEERTMFNAVKKLSFSVLFASN
jgi:hypothetical protein